MTDLFTSLKQRKLVQWTIGYLAGAWVLLQVLGQLSDTFAWSAITMRVITVALGFGVLPALVIAWFHGERGRQRPQGSELLVLGLLILFGGALLSRVAQSGSEAAVAPAADLDGSAITSVAVLPFVNTGGHAEDEYFSDGMTDELAHALVRLGNLRVAGRTSSYSYKGKQPAPQEVGKTLSVAAVVQGSVRRAGDRLRVIAQLASARDGTVLWSDDFESRSTDVFAVQDSFTQAIVAALAPALRGDAAAAARNGRGTEDKDAYDLYLQGRFFWAKRGAANLQRAIQYFERALARDPSFARAHAGLAMTYSILPSYGPIPDDSAAALAIASGQRSIQLDSLLADGHVALARGGFLRRNWPEAEKHFQRAILLEPANPTAHHWRSINFYFARRFVEAYSEAQQAARLDPLSAIMAADFALLLTSATRFREAITEGRRSLELDTLARALHALSFAYLFEGQLDSARLIAEAAYRSDNAQVRPMSMSFNGSANALAAAYIAAGRTGEARRIAQATINSTRPSARPVQQAIVHLMFDEQVQLRALLERDPEVRGPLTLCHPLFAPIRDDPKQLAYERKLGLPRCPGRVPPLTRR